MGYSQPITQYLDFNGRYDFLMFGNTNNVKGNSTALEFNCSTDNKSSSTANFTLPVTASGIKKAILYWSGSGSGDWDVNFSGPNGLNNMALTAEHQFGANVTVQNGNQPYFGARYDITDVLRTHGTGSYTLSNLDANRGSAYCTQTLYSGWVVVVVYEDPTLTLNSVKLYDGLIGFAEKTIDFSLGGLSINNPDGAKLAFVVWEGDNLSNLGNEGMRVNNNNLVNSINPLGGLFNSTNSFTGQDENFNMDMDFFDISPFVSAGDTDIDISMTAGNDVIFLNIYAITFNNELPDATVKINSHTGMCDEEDITFTYTVYNNPANDTLPGSIDIAFYANSPNGVLLGSQKTPSELIIGDSIIQTITLVVPASLGTNFKIYAVAEAGNSVIELFEDNNVFEYDYAAPVSYSLTDIQGICEGDTLFWGGYAYTEPVDQEYYFSTQFGCDSTVHLILEVQENVSTDIEYEMCLGYFYVMPLGDTIYDSGLYSDILTSQYGCDSTVNVTLSLLNPNSFVSISGDTIVKLGYTLPLFLTANFTPDSIQWTPDMSVECDSCMEVQVTPYNQTTYTVWIYDDLGCLLKDSIEINVIKNDAIYIPNAFSPNGDGINDFLFIQTDKDVKDIVSFQIFDRWGSLVYDGNVSGAVDRHFYWNGIYKDKLLDTGVYVYQAKVRFFDDRIKLFSGDVTLIR